MWVPWGLHRTYAHKSPSVLEFPAPIVKCKLCSLASYRHIIAYRIFLNCTAPLCRFFSLVSECLKLKLCFQPIIRPILFTLPSPTCTPEHSEWTSLIHALLPCPQRIWVNWKGDLFPNVYQHRWNWQCFLQAVSVLDMEETPWRKGHHRSLPAAGNPKRWADTKQTGMPVIINRNWMWFINVKCRLLRGNVEWGRRAHLVEKQLIKGE